MSTNDIISLSDETTTTLKTAVINGHFNLTNV